MWFGVSFSFLIKSKKGLWFRVKHCFIGSELLRIFCFRLSPNGISWFQGHLASLHWSKAAWGVARWRRVTNGLKWTDPPLDLAWSDAVATCVANHAEPSFPSHRRQSTCNAGRPTNSILWDHGSGHFYFASVALSKSSRSLGTAISYPQRCAQDRSVEGWRGSGVFWTGRESFGVASILQGFKVFFLTISFDYFTIYNNYSSTIISIGHMFYACYHDYMLQTYIYIFIRYIIYLYII